jgi:hypothetical protein
MGQEALDSIYTILRIYRKDEKNTKKQVTLSRFTVL